ncbi:MAG: phosphoribosyl-AMP cyclohydrolase [Clostridiales bacterium]|nr:phosphoribosyl-AMP cyclohydrolase [Clostridiales bacterium]
MKELKDLKFDKDGLITIVTQDELTKEVLMVAYAKLEQIQATLLTRKATYFSRSRNQTWVKGETSGHYQEVIDVKVDCDHDAVLYIVNQIGAACHTNEFSCFYRKISEKGTFEDEKK